MSDPIQNPGMSAGESKHWNRVIGLVPVQEQRWMEHAACAVVHPDAESHRKFADMWFAGDAAPGRPKSGGSEPGVTTEAKRICGGCSVRAECLMFSLVNKERFGVWGQLGAEERDRIRKREPEKYQAPDDGRCKRGHSAGHRVPDGRGSTKCLKCSDIAAERYRAGVA